MSETHKKSAVKTEEKKNEVDVFFPKGGTVKLPSIKEPLTVKKFTWGKEAILGKMLGQLLKEINLGDFQNLTENNIKGDPQIVVTTFLPLLQNAPETVTKIVATILDKEEKWVNDSLDSEDIIEVLVPFFIGAFRKYQNMASNVSRKFPKR